MRKRYGFFLAVLVIIIVPTIINYVCLSTVPFNIVADKDNQSSSIWLNFFGCYFGGVVTSAISLFIFYRTLQKDKYEKEYELDNNRYVAFCNDLSKLAVCLDTDRLAYIILSLIDADNKEMTMLMKEICEIEMQLKDKFNSFMLVYGEEPSNQKDKFVKEYTSISHSIRDQLEILFDIVAEYKKESSKFLCGRVSKKVFRIRICQISKSLESFGDISKPILNLAEDWKKEKWIKREQLRTKYLNYPII